MCELLPATDLNIECGLKAATRNANFLSFRKNIGSIVTP